MVYLSKEFIEHNMIIISILIKIIQNNLSNKYYYEVILINLSSYELKLLLAKLILNYVSIRKSHQSSNQTKQVGMSKRKLQWLYNMIGIWNEIEGNYKVLHQYCIFQFLSKWKLSKHNCLVQFYKDLTKVRFGKFSCEVTLSEGSKLEWIILFKYFCEWWKGIQQNGTIAGSSPGFNTSKIINQSKYFIDNWHYESGVPIFYMEISLKNIL